MNTAANQVQIAEPYPPGKKRIRIAVALFYFCMGLCFATWASRIPDIKTALNLGDAALGTILFALPVGSFLMMPVSGKLVTHFGSRKVIRFAVPGYTLCMTNLGLATLVLLIVSLNYGKLVKGKSGPSMASSKKGFFSKPESTLLQLGVIGFCSMASEGAMFDWSGVYFKDVVHAPSSLVILGYTSFMIMMTLGRFIADGLVIRFGRKRLLQVSGFLISTGLFTSVFFPFLIASTIGFMMVGLGVSSIVPSVYSAAGRQGKVAPGIALATVSSVSFLGFLMGPPLIGYISAAAGLRYSFAVIGIFGICITLLVSKIKAMH